MQTLVAIVKNGKVVTVTRKTNPKKVGLNKDPKSLRRRKILRVVNLDTDHYERGCGEVFFRNMTTSTFNKFPWSSKRKGEIAYTQQGQELSTSLKPVFVSEEDYKVACMSALPDSLVV